MNTAVRSGPSTAGWWLVLAGLAVLFAPVYWTAAHELWPLDEQMHGPIVLLVSAWLFWGLREPLAALPARPRTGWGASLFTLGLMIGISVNDTTLGTTIANLGMTEVRFPKPVFHGDTLRVTTEVLSRRETRSRPDAGIVEFLHKAINQRGEVVAECRRQAMMRRRPKA